MIRYVLSLLYLCLFFGLNAQRLYVDESKATSGDGGSWSTAFKSIEEAVVSGNGNELWIKEGAYSLPSINLPLSMAIYGGFAGNETALDQRTPSNNTTVLNSQSNSTLFIITGSNQTYVFDQLEVTGTTQMVQSNLWNENNTYTFNNLYLHDITGDKNNGIISIFDTQKTILNIFNSRFERCSAIIYSKDKVISSNSFHIEINGCVFIDNTSSLLYLYLTNQILFENCQFINNLNTAAGDIITIYNSDVCIFSNTIFEGNNYNEFLINLTFVPKIQFESCRFTRNKVGKNAHLIWSIYNASLIVNNSLFKENETANYIFSDEDMYDDQRDERTTVIQSSTFTENLISGIILNIDKTSSWSSRKDKVEFVNNIVWDNTFSASTPIGEAQFVLKPVANSCIGSDQKFDIYTQSNVINTPPQFTNPSTGNYTLSCSSPCINTGLNPAITTGTTDLAGNGRVQNGVIDMGAYESAFWPYAVPVVAFTSVPNPAVFNEKVVFTNTTTNKALYTYKWLVDGVETAADANGNLSYAFTMAGEHRVKLMAQGTCEVKAEKEQLISVSIPEPSFTFNTNQSCVNTPINLINNTANKNALTFTWFQGVTPLAQDAVGNTSVSFSNPGSYAISLRASDAAGSSTSKTQSITIDSDSPSFTTTNNNPCIRELVTYKNTSSGMLRDFTYQWYVNDVLKASSIDFDYSFTSEGTYTIKLVSLNTTCGTENIITQQITIVEPKASLATTTPNPVLGTKVLIENTTINKTGLTFTWLVDGVLQTGTEANSLNVVFNKLGKHTVVLKSQDKCGNSAQQALDLSITQAPLSIVVDKPKPCVNDKVVYKTDDLHANGYTLQWSINKVVVSTDPTFSYTISTYGTYVCDLKATDGEGNIQNQTFTITITDPKPSFSFNNTLFCVNKAVTATNLTASPTNLQFKWAINDTPQNMLSGFSYTPTQAGVYTIRLSSTNECGLTSTTSNAFEIKGVSPSFTASNNNVYINTPILYNNTTPATEGFTNRFNFGDGKQEDVVSGGSVFHSYATSGTYVVSLIATDACGGTVVSTKNTTIKPYEKLAIIATIPTYATDVYYFESSVTCGQLNWTVPGGTIVSGVGTSKIGVKWNSDLLRSGTASTAPSTMVSLSITNCGDLIYEQAKYNLVFNNTPCFVSSTNDSGEGSLREAIECVNKVGSLPIITFLLEGTGPHVFTILSKLPELKRAVIVDGYTQWGNKNGDQLVFKAGAYKEEVLTVAGNQIVIQGLKIQDYTNGIVINEKVNNSSIAHIIFDNIANGAVIVNGNSSFNTFNKNTFNKCNSGITVKADVTSLKVENCSFTDGDYAINALANTSGSIQNNTTNGTKKVSISIKRVTDALTIKNNNVSYHSGKAISISEGEKITILNNTISGESVEAQDGVYMNLCKKSEITNNTINKVTFACHLLTCENILIKQNHFVGITGNGIELDKSDKILITQNTTKELAEGAEPINLNLKQATPSNDGLPVPVIKLATYKNKRIVLMGSDSRGDGELEFYLTDATGRDLLKYIGSTTIDHYGNFVFYYPVANINEVNTYYFRATIRTRSYTSTTDMDLERTSQACAAFNPNLKTCSVTSNSDNNEIGTMRYNIGLANKGECTLMLFELGNDRIIEPKTALPVISASVLTIDGTSQPGYVMYDHQVLIQQSKDLKSALEVDGQGMVAVHGLTLSNFDTPLIIRNTHSFDASESLFSEYKTAPFEITSTTHDSIYFDDNSFKSKKAAVGIAINAPRVSFLRNKVEAGNDIGLSVTAAKTMVNENSFERPTSNGSNKNSIGVTANANTNTSIISFNQIDGYDLGFKLSNVDDLQIYTNSINQKVYDEYTTLFDQATDKKPIFKGDLMAYGVLVEKGTSKTSLIGNSMYLANYGVHATQAPKIKILSSIIDSCNVSGIYINACDTALVGYNMVSKVMKGVEVINSDSLKIVGNTLFHHQTAGIHLAKNCDSTFVHKNYIGDISNEGTLRSNGVGILIESSYNTIGGGSDSSNVIMHNLMGGITVDGGTHNRLSYNAIYENDSTLNHSTQLAIKLVNLGNNLKATPTIIGYDRLEGKGKYLLRGTSMPGDTVHVYRSEGAYQSTRYFADRTVARSDGKWELALDVADTIRFKKYDPYQTLTFTATATDLENNTSQVSNLIYVGTCYLNSNEDNGDDLYPAPNSLRQCVVCANSMEEPAEIKVAIQTGRSEVFLDKALPHLTVKSGLDFEGKNVRGDLRNLIISNGHNPLFDSITTTWTITDKVDSLKLRRVQFMDTDTALMLLTKGKVELKKIDFSLISNIGVYALGSNHLSMDSLTFENMSKGAAIKLSNAEDVVMTDLRVKQTHTALDLHNSKNVSITKAQIASSSTLLSANGMTNLIMEDNKLQALDASKNINWNQSTGAFMNNQVVMDKSSSPLLFSSSKDMLIIADNMLVGTCDTCIQIVNCEALTLKNNTITEARITGVLIENSKNVLVLNNTINKALSQAFTLKKSDQIKISQNKVVLDEKGIVTIDKQVIMPKLIHLNKDTDVKSNTNRSTPTIEKYMVKRENENEVGCETPETRLALFLEGTSEPSDSIEIFFTGKKVDGTELYLTHGQASEALATQADLKGRWSLRIPREFYHTDDQKDYHFIVTATDAIGNTSETSKAIHIDEVVRELEVTHGGNDGDGSLRQALINVNCADVRAKVVFNMKDKINNRYEIVLMDEIPPIESFLGFDMLGSTQYTNTLKSDKKTTKTDNQIFINGAGLKEQTVLFDITKDSKKSTISNLTIENTELPMRIQNEDNTIDSLTVVYLSSDTSRGDVAIEVSGNGSVIKDVSVSGYTTGVRFHKSASSNKLLNSKLENVTNAVLLTNIIEEEVAPTNETPTPAPALLKAGASSDVSQNSIQGNRINFLETGIELTELTSANQITANAFGDLNTAIPGSAIVVKNSSLQRITSNVMPYGDNKTAETKAFIEVSGTSGGLFIENNNIGMSKDTVVIENQYSNMMGIRLTGSAEASISNCTLFKNTIVALTQPAITAKHVSNTSITGNGLGVDDAFKLKGQGMHNFSLVPGINNTAIELDQTNLMTVSGNTIVNYGAGKNGIDVKKSAYVVMEQNQVFSERSDLKGINLNALNDDASNQDAFKKIVMAPSVTGADVQGIESMIISGTTSLPNTKVMVYESFGTDSQTTLPEKNQQAKLFLNTTISDAAGKWSLQIPTENYGFSDKSQFVAQVTVDNRSSELSACYFASPLLCQLAAKGISLLDDLYTPCPGSDFTLDCKIKGADLTYSWTASNNEFATIEGTQVAKIETSATVKLLVSNGQPECNLSDVFKVQYKPAPYKPDFVISTNCFAGDTIVLVDVSNHWGKTAVGNTITWKTPSGIVPVLTSDLEKGITENEYTQISDEFRIIAPEEGSYVLKQRSTLGDCYVEQDRTIVVTYKDPSIQEPYRLVPKTNTFSIYPNPATGDVIQTFIKSSTKDVITVRLLDLEGKLLYTTKVGNKLSYQLDIPTSGFKTGDLYIVSVQYPTIEVTQKVLLIK